ncbi:conserved hypothetical protein [Candidatus Zixiibacteriota bacterium]|nr:conserved hypothetical protein [candidate division Zixibacteria bacterium]
MRLPNRRPITILGMMRIGYYLFLALFIVSAAFGAKYAEEPFSLGVGGRALGMGGATIAGPFDGTAAYWNPAGMNYLDGRYVAAMHGETFGSLLNHDFAAYVSSRPNVSALLHSYGFYVYYLGGGGVNITDINAQGRPYVVSQESHGDVMLAGSAGGRYRNIDIGVSARLIYRDIVAAKGYGISFDAGALYQPLPYARLGLAITDVTSGLIHYDNGTTESIYPTVKPGLLLWRKFSDFTGRLAVSGDLKFEGIRRGAQYWMGNISLDTHYGAEISYREMFFGRAGFDIGDLTAGVGMLINRVQFDFAWMHNDYLDETFRMSAGYRF